MANLGRSTSLLDALIRERRLLIADVV